MLKNTVLEETYDVYDITVEDVHEFFANGILVSNCDAMRYAIYTRHLHCTDVSTAKLDLENVGEKIKKAMFDPRQSDGPGSNIGVFEM